MVIEEKEYEALFMLTSKVAHLENLLEEQLKFIGTKETTYALKAGPSFAFKASQLHIGIEISEVAQESKTIASNKVKDESSKRDKGKAKMYEGASFNNDGLMSSKTIDIFQSSGLEAKNLKKHQIVSVKGSVETNSIANILDTKLNKMGEEMQGSGLEGQCEQSGDTIIQGEYQDLGADAVEYIHSSLQHMVDSPLSTFEFLSAEEMLMEFAMLEEIKLKKAEEEARKMAP